MKKVLEAGLGCLVLIILVVIALIVIGAVVGSSDSTMTESEPTVAIQTNAPTVTAMPVVPVQATTPRTTTASAGATTTPTNSESTSRVPQDVTWRIVDSSERFMYVRSDGPVANDGITLRIEISREIDEQALAAVAASIRKEYVPTDRPSHLLFYQPNTRQDRAAWAYVTTGRPDQDDRLWISDHWRLTNPSVTVTPRPRPTRTPTSQVIYAACDDVPTYLLRLDTKNRVAVERAFVPSQPDGDDDGFACGDQLEHKRQWAKITATPTSEASIVEARTAQLKAIRAQAGTTACLTPAEQRYMDALTTDLRPLESSMSAFARLLQTAVVDGQIVPTASFATDFARQATALRIIGQRIMDRSLPTSRLRAVDTEAWLLGKSLVEGVQAFTAGVTTRDANKFRRGATVFLDAERYRQSAEREAARVCG